MKKKKGLINLVPSVHHTFSDNVVQCSTIQIPWPRSWYFRYSDTLTTEKIVLSLEVLKKPQEPLYMDCCGISWQLVSHCINIYSYEDSWFTQAPGPSAFLVETEESPQNTEGDTDAPEPASEGDTETEHFSHQLCGPRIGSVT